MKTPTTFIVEASSAERCKGLVESGQFDSVSEVVDYAMRTYYDHLLRNRCEIIAHIPRCGPRTKISFRINNWIFSSLMNTGLFARAELLDYALEHYWSVLDSFSKQDS